jgi:alpha-galactosidase
MKKILTSITLLLISLNAYAQGSWDGKNLLIQNKGIKRVIVLENGQFSTMEYRLTGTKYNYVATQKGEPLHFDKQGAGHVGEFRRWRGPKPDEFSFLLNGEKVTGKTGWKVSGVKEEVKGEEKLYKVGLKGTAEINKNIELTITYILYADIPLVRKKIDFENVGTGELKIESLDIESLNIAWGNTHNHIYNKYGRYKHTGPFVGNWDDPLVVVHDPVYSFGVIAGNETPGVLKRTSVCTDGREFSIGLTHVDQDYAFRAWLDPGETFESTWVFTSLFRNSNPREVLEGDIADFVRKYMGIRLAQIPQRPTFVYNTWEPFRGRVSEKLIMELADAAASCGIEEFVIDDGWQSGFGDWGINKRKFPNGLKPVFDYIKSKGMKPGLWLSMGAASRNSKVYKEHPDWFVKDRNGKDVNLHIDRGHVISACMTSEWKDYMKGVILRLVKEHGLEYVKLDFAIVASAYRYDNDVSGCFAKGHSHKDREESYLEIYRAAWQMYDELHEEAPNLFIDCTFETMGKLQLIDFDMCKHAEGNWLSNFEGGAPTGSARVRQMSWWRSSVIPATALVIGNQSLDDEHALFSYKSLCGSLPIMLGDPRKMGVEKQKQFKAYSSWMRSMEEKHNIMLFRQDLPGFGEPMNGSWDGFQRINTETQSGGIIGVFKQFSNVNERWVTINYLDPDTKYIVTEAPTDKVVTEATGAQLGSRGFKVVFEEQFQGELYEVREVKSDQAIRKVRLSSLKPVDHLQGWGWLRCDTNLHGKPLQIGDRKFTHGLGTHAKGHIVYDLDEKYKSFQTWVGVDANVKSYNAGSVIFRILADGKEVFDSGTMKNDTPAKQLQIDVSGVKELKLLAENAGDGSYCDHANWAEAMLIPVKPIKVVDTKVQKRS